MFISYMRWFKTNNNQGFNIMKNPAILCNRSITMCCPQVHGRSVLRCFLGLRCERRKCSAEELDAEAEENRERGFFYIAQSRVGLYLFEHLANHYRTLWFYILMYVQASLNHLSILWKHWQVAKYTIFFSGFSVSPVF